MQKPVRTKLRTSLTGCDVHNSGAARSPVCAPLSPGDQRGAHSEAVAAQLRGAGPQRHAQRLRFEAFGEHPAAPGGPLGRRERTSQQRGTV